MQLMSMHVCWWWWWCDDCCFVAVGAAVAAAECTVEGVQLTLLCPCSLHFAAGFGYQLPCRQYVLATLMMPSCTTCIERGCRGRDCHGNILERLEAGGWRIHAPHHKRAGK